MTVLLRHADVNGIVTFLKVAERQLERKFIAFLLVGQAINLQRHLQAAALPHHRFNPDLFHINSCFDLQGVDLDPARRWIAQCHDQSSDIAGGEGSPRQLVFG